jgi:hypothetical protein
MFGGFVWNQSFETHREFLDEAGWEMANHWCGQWCGQQKRIRGISEIFDMINPGSDPHIEPAAEPGRPQEGRTECTG